MRPLAAAPPGASAATGLSASSSPRATSFSFTCRPSREALVRPPQETKSAGLKHAHRRVRLIVRHNEGILTASQVFPHKLFSCSQ